VEEVKMKFLDCEGMYPARQGSVKKKKKEEDEEEEEEEEERSQNRDRLEIES
jgi:hypothetical protein